MSCGLRIKRYDNDNFDFPDQGYFLGWQVRHEQELRADKRQRCCDGRRSHVVRCAKWQHVGQLALVNGAGRKSVHGIGVGCVWDAKLCSRDNLMGFFASAGRMILTDGSGTAKLDTNFGYFVAGTTLSGSKTLSAHTATQQNGVYNSVDYTVNHLLGSCSSDATQVRGAFLVTASDGRGVHNIGWFNAGGTYVHLFANTQPAISLYAGYTFYVSGGGVYLQERVAMIGPPFIFGDDPSLVRSITITAPTFQYKLFVGKFV
jgi:hypothetical protein